MRLELCAAACVVTLLSSVSAAEPPRVPVRCEGGECYVTAEELGDAAVIELDVTAAMAQLPRPVHAIAKSAKKRGRPAPAAVVRPREAPAADTSACTDAPGTCAAVAPSDSGYRLERGGRSVTIHVVRRDDAEAAPSESSTETALPSARAAAAAQAELARRGRISTKCRGCQRVERTTTPAAAAAGPAAAPLGPEILHPDADLGAPATSPSPRLVGPGTLVIGGTPIVSGAPDDISFGDVTLVGDAAGFRCTGVLIAPRVVLTAAHCLPASRVAFGSDLGDLVASAEVRGARPHPDGLDAAVLLLAEAAPFVPRPRRGTADVTPPRGTLRIIGFGADDPRGASGFGVKRRGGVLVNGWGCEGRRPAALGCDPARELVIPPDSARDTCSGDSGGPVLEWTGATWRLVAITSRPARGRENCGSGGIYVRADALAPWLDRVLEEHR